MDEIKGEKAFTLHKKITEIEVVRRKLLFEVMEYVHELHEDKLYRTILGDEKAPWSAYLSQFDTFYTASQIYMFDRIYSKFIKELGCKSEDIADVPNSKLSNIITLVTKENVNKWITNARELTPQDFNDEIRKSQGKTSYLDCPHGKTSTYEICQECGNRHKK